MIRVDHGFSPEFFVSDRESIVYGAELWTRAWEPTQQAFIAKAVSSSSARLLDVGAAVGVYTLLGASIGAEVVAFEPGREIFQELKENVYLNEKFRDRVHLYNGFVVSRSDHGRKLGGIAQRSSGINFSDELFYLEDFFTEQLIIKMDIEGAEWALLQDKSFLQELEKRKFLLFLSVHIGFHSFDFKSMSEKLKYRIGVLKEIATILCLKRRFKYSYELKEGELRKLKISRKNQFNGNGWHENPLVLSNDYNLIKPILKFRFNA
jgi:FkbM family methyltransferase